MVWTIVHYLFRGIEPMKYDSFPYFVPSPWLLHTISCRTIGSQQQSRSLALNNSGDLLATLSAPESAGLMRLSVDPAL